MGITEAEVVRVVRTIECDHCGATDEEGEPGGSWERGDGLPDGWLEFEFSTQDMSAEGTFCGAECAGEYVKANF